MSGIAKATTIDQQIPLFTFDGKFDSGVIAPGKTFQYTVTSFDATSMLDPKVAQRYNIPPEQTVGDISFFDQFFYFRNQPFPAHFEFFFFSFNHIDLTSVLNWNIISLI